MLCRILEEDTVFKAIIEDGGFCTNQLFTKGQGITFSRPASIVGGFTEDQDGYTAHQTTLLSHGERSVLIFCKIVIIQNNEGGGHAFGLTVRNNGIGYMAFLFQNTIAISNIIVEETPFVVGYCGIHASKFLHHIDFKGLPSVTRINLSTVEAPTEIKMSHNSDYRKTFENIDNKICALRLDPNGLFLQDHYVRMFVETDARTLPMEWWSRFGSPERLPMITAPPSSSTAPQVFTLSHQGLSQQLTDPQIYGMDTPIRVIFANVARLAEEEEIGPDRLLERHICVDKRRKPVVTIDQDENYVYLTVEGKRFRR